MKPFLLVIALATAVSLAIIHGPAKGQPLSQAPPAAPTGSAAPPVDEQGGSQEAASRYNRGVELFKEGDYRAALIEFKRAYALAPNYAVLYNIGQVYYQLQDYANALSQLERYLKEGGERIAKKRRKRVEDDIARLRPRVAKLSIIVNAPNAEVFIDDVSIGRSPLYDPVLVSGGRRKITVVKPGQTPQTKRVDIAGGDTRRVRFNLSDEDETKPPPLRGAQPPQTPPPPLVDEKSGLPWAGWLVTAGLTTSALVTGLLALNASSQVEDERNNVTTKDDLDTAANTALGLAIATDLLAAGAIASGTVSLILTLQWVNEDSQHDQGEKGSVKIRAGLNGIAVSGRF